MVHPGEDREVAHAELSLGLGIVMLARASDDMPEVATSSLLRAARPTSSASRSLCTW